MEFLKDVLGEELYQQFKLKVDAHNGDEANKDKLIKLANLTNGEYVGKGKYESLEADLNSKVAELTSANALIEEMKKATVGNDELQTKIGNYETTITDLQAELQKTKLEGELKVALLEAKATDIDYLTYKLRENNQELKLDEKGKIGGIEDMITSLKTQFPNQFETSSQKIIQENKLEKEENNNETLTKNELLKKSYAERNEIYNKDPEAYREMMSK